MKKKWDYRKRATLRTYFVGECLIRFANIYRACYRNRARLRQHSTSADEIALSDFGKPSRGMADKAIDYVTAKRILGDIKDERVVKALISSADGKSQADIAVELEVRSTLSLTSCDAGRRRAGQAGSGPLRSSGRSSPQTTGAPTTPAGSTSFSLKVSGNVARDPLRQRSADRSCHS